MIRFLLNFISVGFVLLCAGLLLCPAQNSRKADYTRKGVVISEGRNSNTGDPEVNGYRLEVFELARPFNMGDGKPPLESAFRLVIVTKDDISLNDFSIWMDDFPYTAVQVGSNELAILIYGWSLPDQTIKLGLSKRGKNDPADRTILSGTLSVPSGYATPIEEILANQPVIRLRRIPPTNTGVELRVEVPRIPCEMKAIPVSLEVDGHTQSTFCDGAAYINWFSPEQFVQLRNGAEIKLRRGGGRNARLLLIVGTLDKTAVQ